MLSQHIFDVVKTRQKFNNKLEPGATLKKQRSNKVTLHLRETLEKLVIQPEHADIITERGDDEKKGSSFVKLVILQLKHEYVKSITDASYPNSMTDRISLFSPFKPISTIMTLISKT